MQYARIENNQVTSINLPTTGVLKDGSTVSGYNLLDAETLKREGWLPLTEDKPIYDETTQYLAFDQYVISADTVVAQYKVADIEVLTPIPQEPSIEERVRAVEDALLIIL